MLNPPYPGGITRHHRRFELSSEHTDAALPSSNRHILEYLALFSTLSSSCRLFNTQPLNTRFLLSSTHLAPPTPTQRVTLSHAKRVKSLRVHLTIFYRLPPGHIVV